MGFSISSCFGAQGYIQMMDQLNTIKKIILLSIIILLILIPHTNDPTSLHLFIMLSPSHFFYNRLLHVLDLILTLEDITKNIMMVPWGT